jgi:hypothetical protein
MSLRVPRFEEFKTLFFQKLKVGRKDLLVRRDGGHSQTNSGSHKLTRFTLKTNCLYFTKTAFKELIRKYFWDETICQATNCKTFLKSK